MPKKSKEFIFRPVRDGDEDPYPDFALKLHPYAFRDIIDAVAYRDERNPPAAERLAHKIYLELRRIEAYPHGYIYCEMEGLIKNVIKSYIIYFTIREPFVIVFRVLHTARRRPEKQLRLLVNAKHLTMLDYREVFKSAFPSKFDPVRR